MDKKSELTMTSLWFFMDNFEHFTPFSSVSVVVFGKVNASRVTSRKVNFKTKYLHEKVLRLICRDDHLSLNWLI